MPRFPYRARTDAGDELAGEIEAADAAAAEAALRADGLQSVELQSPVVRLNVAEATEVLGHVADLCKSQLPLSQGLRAAADEATNGRVARTLQRLAERLEQGEPLETTLTSPSRGYPHYLAGLIAAAARTGRLGLALEDLTDFHRSLRRVHWSLLGSLLYPLLVLAIALTVGLLLLLMLVPAFRPLFDEFDIALPAATRLVLNLSEMTARMVSGAQKWFTLGSAMFLVLVIGAVRVAMGGARWRRLLGTLPLVGPLWVWSGAAAFAKLLSVLVAEEVPLPEALRLTAEAVEDPNVRQACRIHATAVEQGGQLAESLRREHHLPDTLQPFVIWGERTGKLAEGLQTAGEFYFERLRMRAALLRSVAPSVIFVLVAIGAGLCVAAIMIPLFEMINSFI